MAFKYKKNPSGNQIMPCHEDEVCKHGFFIKSPPPQLFTSQKSWKNRYFILCKSSKCHYILKYLKGQQIKGSIPIDQIISIETGISNYEKMTAIRKMFKCQPEEVISISTESRDYYLIGKDREQAEEWYTFISSVCMDAKADGCRPQNEDLATEHTKSRSCSLPLSFSGANSEGPINNSENEEKDPSDDKRRPNSDPCPQRLPKHQPPSSSPGVLPHLQSNIPQKTLEIQLSDSDENTKEEEEEVEEEKEEEYYATPTSILAQLTMNSAEPDPQRNSPMKEEKLVNRVSYISMKPQSPDKRSTCRSDEFLTLPWILENNICLRSSEDDRDQPLTKISTGIQPRLERKPNASPLSVVQLSILMNQVTDRSQLQEVDIFIPKADVNNYLTLTEAAGQICVSHWNGPHYLGCIFHHGDHIKAVNDLHPQNMEEVSLFISRSMRKKVKLTICRIPASDIFHVKGCSCS
ncbi:pleckstrin homology domain-containing family S member 1 isoform X1 [Alligator mississippiensis]|uniref:pleckstrin homology domain-containing family S member 1 isoform X1 n=2 Tax=Alligator mississippiensis TaxID=8496 RepID=UPI002877348B|nr:pleckstrin homology domain-containing family S member 1 isoform X1 [Alligator mississippiensis]